jgi:hypothetical protein
LRRSFAGASLSFKHAFTFALFQNRQDVRQVGLAVADEAEHAVAVDAQGAPGSQHHQQRGDHRDMEAEAHAVSAVAAEVAEVGADLEPSEKQFDFPALAVEFSHRSGRKVQQIGQQPQPPSGPFAIGVLDDDFPENRARRCPGVGPG